MVLAAPFAWGDSVGAAEAAGEVAGVYETPLGGDGGDRQVAGSGGDELAARAFEAFVDEPLFEAEVVEGEQFVEVPQRDVVLRGDLCRSQLGIAQVLADVPDDSAEEDVGHRWALLVAVGC